MLIESDVKLDYSDVLIRPKRSTLSSRSEAVLTRTFSFPYCHYKIIGLPIIASDMDGVGTYDMCEALCEKEAFTALSKNYSVEEHKKYRETYTGDEKAILTVGISDEDYEKVKRLKDIFSIICIDTPNGYMERFVKFVRSIRDLCGPANVIIAGNVVTADQTQELILNGADVVKVGIGPGSVCTTRIVTGIGYPQLSAVIECADAAHGLNGHVVADGGCVNSGDVVKAFAAGADFVMLGGMLAGHTEGVGDVKADDIIWKGDNPYSKKRPYIKFYGMSSERANKEHAGGLKDYRASEGRETLVPLRTSVKHTFQSITGGIRSAMTYIGASTIKHIPKCATFIRVNNTHNTVFEKDTL